MGMVMGGCARINNLPVCEVWFEWKGKKGEIWFWKRRGKKKGGMVFFPRERIRKEKRALAATEGGSDRRSRANDGVRWLEWRGKEGKSVPPACAQCGSPPSFPRLLFLPSTALRSPSLSLSPGEPPPDL
jgi:hypothetical protein